MTDTADTVPLTSPERQPGHYWVRWNGKPWTVARYKTGVEGGVWLYPGWSLEVRNDSYFDEIDERRIERHGDCGTALKAEG